MLGYSKRYSPYNHKTKCEFQGAAENWYVATDCRDWSVRAIQVCKER